MPRRAPLRADSSPVCADLLLAAITSFHSASWSLCVCLGAVWWVLRTLLVVSATQAEFDVLA